MARQTIMVLNAVLPCQPREKPPFSFVSPPQPGQRRFGLLDLLSASVELALVDEVDELSQFRPVALRQAVINRYDQNLHDKQP
jgi:hypothetical protein